MPGLGGRYRGGRYWPAAAVEQKLRIEQEGLWGSGSGVAERRGWGGLRGEGTVGVSLAIN